MTALDDSATSRSVVGSSDVSHSFAVGASVDVAVDDRQVLQEEIERLQQRVADLEFTVAEYRSQMSQVLTSASWKMTSPIRATASRARTAKVKARRAAKRLKQRTGPDADRKVLTAGLFMPDLSALPESSPLRRRIDVNTLRRPVEADGPLERPEGDPRILVVAHVHYPELWADIDDRLVRMPEPFDLICTITEGTAEAAIPHIRSKHPHARIEIVPNRGRDWAPLVRLVNQGLLSGYDAVAKVHTKKSEHRVDGDGWRLALLDGIFESPDQIRKMIDLLKEDRSVGLVVPTGHVAGIEHWGSNQGIIEALAYRLPMAFDPDELQFPAGSMFWCRPWLLERIADLDINDEHFEPEAGQYDATTAHALERLVGVYSTVAGMEIVEAMDVKQRLSAYRKNPQARPNIYAFYLPQYHQCPENDEFWGEGFTDWVNVKKAKPLFDGHRQPILPSEEVGFYDLKDPEVLRKQAKMAKDHGIDGFIFHYYWFDGRKVLDTPLNNWLADPTIDMPLALCWANEPWTRRWDGLDKEVLIPQDLSDGWEDRFWDDVAPAMRDPRYVSIEGKPLLVVYRVGLLPDAARAVSRWRTRAVADGFPGLHLVSVVPSRDFGVGEPGAVGAFDATLTFPPGSGVNLESWVARLGGAPRNLRERGFFLDAAFAEGNLPPVRSAQALRSVMPGWDNTARRPDAPYFFLGANVVTWARILEWSRCLAASDGQPIFINAWNEWAEGAAIEPGSRFGSGFLRTVYESLLPDSTRDPACGRRRDRSAGGS